MLLKSCHSGMAIVTFVKRCCRQAELVRIGWTRVGWQACFTAAKKIWTGALVYLYTCILVYLYTCILVYSHTQILVYSHTQILVYLYRKIWTGALGHKNYYFLIRLTELDSLTLSYFTSALLSMGQQF